MPLMTMSTVVITVLLSSLEKDEFDRVNGLEKSKDIWDTLQRAREERQEATH
jgi:hypothetical protein